jgi:hypothetical protein
LVVTALLGIAAARAYPTTDLFCFATAARLVATGADPYDAGTWATATAGVHPDYRGVLRPSPCPGRFGYPLWTAIVLVPLTWLDASVVGFVWQIGLFAGAAIGVALLSRAASVSLLWLAAAVAMSQPFWLTVLNAQFGGILLGALGAAAFFGARDRAGGLALTLGWLKPHVMLVPLIAIPVRALRSGRSGMAVAVFSTVVAAALVSIAVRPVWPSEYATELLENRTTQTLASTSLVGLSSHFTGSIAPGVVASILVVGAALLLLRAYRLSDLDALAVAVAATLVLSPYLGSHDEVLLAPAWARMLATRGWEGIATVAVLAVTLPWVLYAFRNVIGGPEGLAGLLPSITLIALAIVIRREG